MLLFCLLFCLAFFTRKDCYVQNPVICCGWREIHIRQKIHIARSVWNERCSWDAGREIEYFTDEEINRLSVVAPNIVL